MKTRNSIIEKITDRIDDISLRVLIRIVLVLVVVYLLKMTDNVWKGFIVNLLNICKPFIIGFVIAYILHDPIQKLEGKGVPRKVSIPVLYVLILVLFYWLIASLTPILLDRANGLINSMIDGVNWLYDHYEAGAETQVPGLINTITEGLIDALRELRNLIPSISSKLPNFVSTTLSLFTNAVFAFIISIYITIDWVKIREAVYRFAIRRGEFTVKVIQNVDSEIGTYIRSLLILMIIKFIEYAIMYFLVGHRDWLIVGLLTGLSLLIPYVGPMTANVIGILTGLTMPIPNIIALLICIAVLSNVDQYLISPVVHSRNTSVTPIWALFSVFAGGHLFGMIGVVIAIPVFLAIRSIYHLYIEYFPNDNGEPQETEGAQ